MSIGYDLDWVICRDLRPYEQRLTKCPVLLLRYKSFFKKLFTPQEDAVIITWRPIQDKKETIKRLRKNGINNEIYFNRWKPSTNNAIRTKELRIKALRLDKFYESDKKQAKQLKKLCPSCKILVFNHTKWKK